MKLNLRISLVSLIAVTGMMAANLNVAGNTDGSTTNGLGGTDGGVTFTPGTFSVNIPNGGAKFGVDVGEFDSYCDGIVFNCNGSDPFTLDLDFTAPTGVDGSPTTFTGAVHGEILTLDSQYGVTFSDPVQSFTFNNGVDNGTITFSLETFFGTVPLNDGSYVYNRDEKRYVIDPGTTDLLADICVNYSADPVPEPASVVLLGSAFAGLVFAFRRKRPSVLS